MEKQKHTPGQWEVTHFDGRTQVFAGRRMVVEGLYDEDNEPTLEEVEANARLIAAAPELLEAIKTALSTFRRAYDNIDKGDLDLDGLMGDDSYWPLAILRNVIAKAEGKEI